jgi:acyl dehydratase
MTLDTEHAQGTTIIDLPDLAAARDVALGPSSWVRIDQEQIDLFAEATGDHQWIHVDQERSATGPFGRTIAHGYLTLSLVPRLLSDILDITSRGSGVNYGIDRVRFVSPVREGSEVRMRGRLVGAERRGAGVRYRMELVVELRGAEKQAMVGEFVALALP